MLRFLGRQKGKAIMLDRFPDGHVLAQKCFYALPP